MNEHREKGGIACIFRWYESLRECVVAFLCLVLRGHYSAVFQRLWQSRAEQVKDVGVILLYKKKHLKTKNVLRRYWAA